VVFRIDPEHAIEPYRTPLSKRQGTAGTGVISAPLRVSGVFSNAKWLNLIAAALILIRCTPAMALGITDHVWTIGEMIAAALEPIDIPPLPKEPETTLRPGTRRFRLIVGRGGKGTNKPR
jgi:hypothetical protein